LFEHGGENLQSRSQRQFHQLRLRIDEQIDERQMTERRFGLGTRKRCARLSFHVGSLLAGFRPGLVTTRFTRAVRSRRSQISTATGTSTSCPQTLSTLSLPVPSRSAPCS